MSAQVAIAQEVEFQRQERLAELQTEQEAGWQDQFLRGSFGCHELLDRTSVLADLVEERLLAHPSCVLQPDWYSLAEKAAAALHELYQRIGAEHTGDQSVDA